ncbi:MAG: M48 family metalloprotease [Candidatus Berkiella sp.]
MFSLYSKEKLKNNLLFAAIPVLTIATATLSGLTITYIGYIAALFLLPALPIILFHLDNNRLNEIANLSKQRKSYQRDGRLQEIFITNKKGSIIILLVTIFTTGIPLLAYFHTANLTFFVSLYLLQFMMAIIRPSNELSKFINTFSTSRSLNLSNPKEAQLDKLLKNLCQKLNINPPKVTYLSLLDKVNDENFEDFKKGVAKHIPSALKKNPTKAQLLKNVKRRISPNLMATQSIIDKNHITVFSSIFKHEVKLNTAEIEALLAHELGHHQANDSFKRLFTQCIYMTSITLGLYSLRLAGLALISAVRVTIALFDKSNETNADLFSAQCVGTKNLISFLRKMQKHQEKLNLENNSNACEISYFDQAKGYFNSCLSSYPSDQARIADLEQFEKESKMPFNQAITAL